MSKDFAIFKSGFAPFFMKASKNCQGKSDKKNRIIWFWQSGSDAEPTNKFFWQRKRKKELTVTVEMVRTGYQRTQQLPYSVCERCYLWKYQRNASHSLSSIRRKGPRKRLQTSYPSRSATWRPIYDQQILAGIVLRMWNRL